MLSLLILPRNIELICTRRYLTFWKNKSLILPKHLRTGKLYLKIRSLTFATHPTIHKLFLTGIIKSILNSKSNVSIILWDGKSSWNCLVGLSSPYNKNISFLKTWKKEIAQMWWSTSKLFAKFSLLPNQNLHPFTIIFSKKKIRKAWQTL